ncbi:MAG: hypothetical protein IKN04_13520 [Clostridia bacterium]|nr:hypothetical protein [Clostridia bacterium]
MTFQEIQASSKDFLTPEDVREVVGCMPYSINIQAKEAPEKLGFPVCMMGKTVRIPRMAFIHWMLYGNAPIMMPEPGIYRQEAV